MWLLVPVGSSFKAIPGSAAITRTRRISAETTTEGFGHSIFDAAMNTAAVAHSCAPASTGV
jgi:hypothetical protein